MNGIRSKELPTAYACNSVGLTNLLGGGIIHVGTRLYYVGPTSVFMSANQGDNCKPAGLSTTDVRCLTAINDTLFVGTIGDGIYKRIDWGGNWVAVHNSLEGSVNFSAIEGKGNTLFAGGPIGAGVYRSTDFGANWTLLRGGLASGSYRRFANNSQLIVAGSFGAGVFYSTNNGDTWTKINTGLTDSTIFDLKINDNYLMATTNTQGVFRLALSNLNLAPGLSDIDVKSEISIFPNPTAQHINIRSDYTYLGSFYSLYE